MPYAIAFVAVLGSGLMGYLIRLNLVGGSDAVCDFGAELSCSYVNQSDFAVLFGVPVSVLGLVYFLMIALLAVWKKLRNRYGLIAAFSLFSLVFSAYLSYIEIVVLKSVCLFCEASKLLMVGIVALAFVGAKKADERIKRSWVAAALAVGVIFSFGAYLIQREPATTKDYTALAQCLSERGVAMYSSYICPACAKQKRFFGDAFSGIDEVECHPRGPNTQVERCVEKRISKTPTWIQESDGAEVRRVIGAEKPEFLAAEFGCPVE